MDELEANDLARAIEGLRMSGIKAEAVRAFTRIYATGRVNAVDRDALERAGIDLQGPG